MSLCALFPYFLDFVVSFTIINQLVYPMLDYFDDQLVILDLQGTNSGGFSLLNIKFTAFFVIYDIKWFFICINDSHFVLFPLFFFLDFLD